MAFCLYHCAIRVYLSHAVAELSSFEYEDKSAPTDGIGYREDESWRMRVFVPIQISTMKEIHQHQNKH